MALLYDLRELANNKDVVALQNRQRDFSPYLVHLTSYSANRPVRELLKGQIQPFDISGAMDMADERSFEIFQKIISSGSLRTNSPQENQDLKPCVCLSECTLSGSIDHSERYGRFGFVFEKQRAYAFGARPCLYMDDEVYGEIDKRHDEGEIAGRCHSLANVYRPSGYGQVQDFTIEREWRCFANVQTIAACAVLCPQNYYTKVRKLVSTDIPIYSLDMLYKWCV